MKHTEKLSKDTAVYLKRRRIIAVVSLAVVLLLFMGATWFLFKWFRMFQDEPAAFKEFIDSYGWKGRFIALGIQALQVVISLIPGELVEIGMGYTYGAVEGTLLCLAGVALASSLIFLLVKWLGVRLVELFVSREKIDQLRFINSEKKLKRLIFLLFFIPGTPKDLFTYFIGLTRIRLHEFLIISLIARIPTVVSSTLGGNMIQEREYGKAVLLFLITGAVSLLGIWLYNFIVNKKNAYRERKKALEQPHDD
jgi:uncharacterized membrane protein YdjX (TVP38/TMEM64 family)